MGLNPLHRRAADRDRRVTALDHPGDAYAYDMFAQAGSVVRDITQGVLAGLTARRLIAIGESQSAAHLVTFVNAIDSLAPVFDGYLIHSRFRNAAPLDGNYRLSFQNTAERSVTGQDLIRADVRVPVLVALAAELYPGEG